MLPLSRQFQASGLPRIFSLSLSTYAKVSPKTGANHESFPRYESLSNSLLRHAALRLADRCQHLYSALKQYEKKSVPDRMVQYLAAVFKSVVGSSMMNFTDRHARMTRVDVSTRSKIRCRDGRRKAGITCWFIKVTLRPNLRIAIPQ